MDKTQAAMTFSALFMAIPAAVLPYAGAVSAILMLALTSLMVPAGRVKILK